MDKEVYKAVKRDEESPNKVITLSLGLKTVSGIQCLIISRGIL